MRNDLHSNLCNIIGIFQCCMPEPQRLLMHEIRLTDTYMEEPFPLQGQGSSGNKVAGYSELHS